MSNLISCDTETTGLDLYHNAAPFMVRAMDDEGASFLWEWSVDPISRMPQITDPQWEDLANFLEGKEIVFHHADFDLRALSRIGIGLHCNTFQSKSSFLEGNYVLKEVSAIHDTQILSHVVNSQGTGDNSSDLGRHALKPLAQHYLDIPAVDEGALRKATVAARRIGKKLGWTLGKDLSGESAVEADYWMPKACWELVHGQIASHDPEDIHVPVEWVDLCETYCEGDCYRTIGLFLFFQEMLEAEPALKKQYERELRCLPVIHNIEHFGMYVAKENGKKYHQDLLTDAKNLKDEAESLLCKATGKKSINCNSGPLQLATALQECGIPLAKRTPPSKKFPTGQWCTDAKVLRSLAQYSESPRFDGCLRPAKEKMAGEALRAIVGWHPDDGDDCDEPTPGYKTFQTGAGYVAGYMRCLDKQSVIHPSYAQVGTAWTRLACREPNGQNISTKSVLPLRRLFGPPPGYVWIDIDYSQLEARIYATAADDQGLLDAFAAGYDFHMATAMQLFSLPPEKISKEQRRIAKNVNFGILFGAGPAKIDMTTGQPGTYKLYCEKFPNAPKFMEKATNEVLRTGYVYTLTGYKLRVPDDKPYACVNAIVQGTAGDLAKLAMIDLHEKGLIDWVEPTKELPYGGSAIVANIHDSLVIQIPLTYPYRAIGRRIKSVMESSGLYAGVITPCTATLITTNWAEGESLG